MTSVKSKNNKTHIFFILRATAILGARAKDPRRRLPFFPYALGAHLARVQCGVGRGGDIHRI